MAAEDQYSLAVRSAILEPEYCSLRRVELGGGGWRCITDRSSWASRWQCGRIRIEYCESLDRFHQSTCQHPKTQLLRRRADRIHTLHYRPPQPAGERDRQQDLPGTVRPQAELRRRRQPNHHPAHPRRHVDHRHPRRARQPTAGQRQLRPRHRQRRRERLDRHGRQQQHQRQPQPGRGLQRLLGQPRRAHHGQPGCAGQGDALPGRARCCSPTCR